MLTRLLQVSAGVAAFAIAATLALEACDLNPQPLPPGYVPADGGALSGLPSSGDAGSGPILSGGGSDAGSVAIVDASPGEDGGAALPPSIDAGTDGAADAGSALDASTDSALDARDAAEDGDAEVLDASDASEDAQ